jgi:CO/xanthine dehydrogenase Mo-binding subunit
MGKAKYIEDFSFPGMLYAKVLRSAHPHARILRVDTSKAEAISGVMATLTAAEIPLNLFGPHTQDQPVLAGDKVRHMGDGVAAVAAVTEEVAAEALTKIEVNYEPLPPVFDPLDAMKDTAPKIHEPRSNIYNQWRIERGNVEQVLANADLVLEERYTTQMVDHAYMEPHAAIAYWEPSRRLTVWSTLGRIFLVRADLGRVLKMPINRIRVVSTQVGGCFGGKNEITLEPILALLAQKAGAPVKGVLTREEEFLSTTKRHPFVIDYATAAHRSGRILGRKVRLVADGGAYASWSETALGKATILSSGPYKIENFLAEGFAVYTNKTMTGAFRGFGAPQECFACESHMDNIAQRLGKDPLEIRLLNAFDEGSITGTGQVLQSVAIKETLTVAAERFGWKDWRR